MLQQNAQHETRQWTSVMAGYVPRLNENATAKPCVSPLFSHTQTEMGGGCTGESGGLTPSE